MQVKLVNMKVMFEQQPCRDTVMFLSHSASGGDSPFDTIFLRRCTNAHIIINEQEKIGN